MPRVERPIAGSRVATWWAPTDTYGPGLLGSQRAWRYLGGMVGTAILTDVGGVSLPVSLDFTSPPQLRADNVHGCIHPGDPESGVAVVNMRALGWIDPAGLVAIATFAESQWRIGRVPRLIAPDSDQLARYLARMHLGDVIDGLNGWHNLPSVREQDQEGKLLELQRFQGEDAPPELAKLVEGQLGETDAAIAVHNGICEIGQNVPHHSAGDVGYIAAITTPSTNLVHFAVGDAGVGLLEPLAASGYASHVDVMRALFATRGVTRTGEVGRGNGVFRTREAVTGSGGSLYLASGRSALVATRRSQREVAGDYAIPGTLLQASMPC